MQKKPVSQQFIDGIGWGLIISLPIATWKFFLFAVERGAITW